MVLVLVRMVRLGEIPTSTLRVRERGRRRRRVQCDRGVPVGRRIPPREGSRGPRARPGPGPIPGELDPFVDARAGRREVMGIKIVPSTDDRGA